MTRRCQAAPCLPIVAPPCLDGPCAASLDLSIVSNIMGVMKEGQGFGNDPHTIGDLLDWTEEYETESDREKRKKEMQVQGIWINEEVKIPTLRVTERRLTTDTNEHKDIESYAKHIKETLDKDIDRWFTALSEIQSRRCSKTV